MNKKIIFSLVLAVCLAAGTVVVCAPEGFGLHDTAASAGYEVSTAPTISKTIGQVVSVVLGLVGLVFFGLLLYGGLVWMTARGKEEKVESAKGTIEAAVIGIIIIAASYAIASFVIGRIGAGSEVGSCNYSDGADTVCQAGVDKALCDQFSGAWEKDGVCAETPAAEPESTATTGSCTVTEGDASTCFDNFSQSACQGYTGSSYNPGGVCP